MEYKPELGIFGNLARLYVELANVDKDMHKTKAEQMDVDAMVVDQEYRLALLELGLAE